MTKQTEPQTTDKPAMRSVEEWFRKYFDKSVVLGRIDYDRMVRMISEIQQDAIKSLIPISESELADQIFKRLAGHAIAPRRAEPQAVPDEDEEPAFSNGITYAIERLAEIIKAGEWHAADGSETLEGAVCGTIINVLKAARIYDDNDGTFATLPAAAPTPPTVSAWQPIETAPRDGTEIIGCYVQKWGDDNLTIYGPWTMAFERKKWRSSWDSSEVLSYMSDFGSEYKEPDCDPTHWMPLPAAPKPEEKA